MQGLPSKSSESIYPSHVYKEYSNQLFVGAIIHTKNAKSQILDIIEIIITMRKG